MVNVMSSGVETSLIIVKAEQRIVRDSSTSLGMTKKANLAILIVLASAFAAFAQESLTPSPTPIPSGTPSSTPIPSPTPEQTPPRPPARNVQLKFVPPPMEGTISLGIFDSNRKLVRILHREAAIDEFKVDENSLNTTWDGKNDAGEDLPPGKYRVRGYMVARFKVEQLGEAAALPKDASDHVFVKLVMNPLISDTRAVVEITVGLDVNGSFLKTTDGLPLRTITQKPGDAAQAFDSIVKRALITKSGENAVDVWEDWARTVDQTRVSNIDKMMAFDCGDFELK